MANDPKPTLRFRKSVTKAKLTKRVIEAIEPPSEQNGKPMQAWVYDAQTPRLAICVWTSGSKSWYWVGRFGSAMVRLKLGGSPEVTPEQARMLATRISADVANGIDPRAERNQSRQEWTLGELFSQYLERHAKLFKRTWENDERQFQKYAKTLHNRRLSTISRSDVMRLHASVGAQHGHTTANRLLSLFSKIFTFAVSVGIDITNPARGVKRFRETSRERFLNADELRRFLDALESETALFHDFFMLLLLTGARRGNVQAMRFDELNLELRTWRISTTKNHEPLTVHLPEQAVEILKQRQRERDGNPWVFPGGKKNQQSHLKEPKSAWDRVCKRAKLSDVRIHDLRRTMGSWQAASGTSLHIIGKSLGHKTAAATRIYARLDLEPVRQAVDIAVAAMMAAAKETTSAVPK